MHSNYFIISYYLSLSLLSFPHGNLLSYFYTEWCPDAYYYQQNQLGHMLTTRSALPSTTPALLLPKTNSHSLSTEQSPRCSLPPTKEKSQLCKRFIEDGCCPYQQRCKFAHGLHELKKNQQQNSKYKTKSCGTFLQQGCCLFGNRCNFIHAVNGLTQRALRRDLDPEMMEIKYSVESNSRLLRILGEMQ